MPIHPSWAEMIHAMAKEYTGGKTRCYDLSNGKKICAPKKAWRVFYAKVTKDYGRGAETKPRDRKVSESDEEIEVSELSRDIMIDWLLEQNEIMEDEE